MSSTQTRWRVVSSRSKMGAKLRDIVIIRTVLGQRGQMIKAER